MTGKISVKNLLGIKSLTLEDIQLVFNTTKNFKEVINRSIKKVPSLRDITIANIFYENSTRTKLSFELAQKRLSADVINFSTSSSSVNKGESLLDTVKNILSMKVDMVVLRHPHPGAAEFVSKNIDTVVINAGDGTHEHPTQALLDGYTILEKTGNLKNLNILIVGDIKHSRVALSDILLFNKLGANVGVCGPKSLIPKDIEKLNVKVFTNLNEALKWTDVVNMLRIQKERFNDSFFPSEREYTSDYGLTKNRLDLLSKKLLILHPGPINRGIEITSEVVDSLDSSILQQVENGVAVRMATTFLLAENIQILKHTN